MSDQGNDFMTIKSNKYARLFHLQHLPLEEKIKRSTTLIREWYEWANGNVVVSFSGGMDSTVLLHLVRQSFPNTPALTVKSLLYPEILAHVRGTPNVELLCPGMPFGKVLEKYGYPVIGKRQAQYIGEVQRAKGETATKRLRLTGVKSNGEYSPMGMISKKWQYLTQAPFPISNKCCDKLKKKPLNKALRGRMPFVGTRCEESQQRRQTYYIYGANARDISYPRSTPLAFWLDADIWKYVNAFQLPYAEVYDMGYKRTGCFACMFGVHLEKEPNRFQRMQQTHPRLWKACEKWGIPQILDYIGVSHAIPDQMALFDMVASGKVLPGDYCYE